MASAVHTGITPQTLFPASKSKSVIKPYKNQILSSKLSPPQQRSLSTISSTPKLRFAARSVAKELDVLPVQSGDSTDQQDGTMTLRIEREGDRGDRIGQVVGGFEGRLSLDGVSGGVDAVGIGGGGGGGKKDGEEDIEKLIDRAINASIVLAAGSFAVTKLLTIDRDYWHGWTIFEILRYAPQHSWSAYEEALKTNPVLAKMMISGVVYSAGDWIAQCVEGKPLFEFDRARMFRSGLVGFTLHGSLSHYYYEFCEALFPFKGWWVVPVKVAFDQTAWSALWNSIYYTVVGILRRDSPVSIFNELRATFWPMLTAGWKLWPFAHLVTYGVIPVEQRLLWVDSIELIWVTILSTYSNEATTAPNSAIRSGSGSFRVEIGSISRRHLPSDAGSDNHGRSFSIGSFDYIVDDAMSEVAVASTRRRLVLAAGGDKSGRTDESEIHVVAPPGETVAAEVAAGGERSRNSWLKDYVERMAWTPSFSLSSSFRSSGRFFAGSSRRTDASRVLESDLEASRLGDEISEMFRWLSGV